MYKYKVFHIAHGYYTLFCLRIPFAELNGLVEYSVRIVATWLKSLVWIQPGASLFSDAYQTFVLVTWFSCYLVLVSIFALSLIFGEYDISILAFTELFWAIWIVSHIVYSFVGPQMDTPESYRLYNNNFKNIQATTTHYLQKSAYNLIIIIYLPTLSPDKGDSFI